MSRASIAVEVTVPKDLLDQMEGLRERIEYLERIERAFKRVEEACCDQAPELYPVGPARTIFAEDGNTVLGYEGPWCFEDGGGGTFLEAVEDSMKPFAERYQQRTEQK